MTPLRILPGAERRTPGMPSVLLSHPCPEYSAKLTQEIGSHFRVLDRAPSGLETLRRLRRLRPEVLVVAEELEGLGGWEVVRELPVLSPHTVAWMLEASSGEDAAEAGFPPGLARVSFERADPAEMAARLADICELEGLVAPRRPRPRGGELWTMCSPAPAPSRTTFLITLAHVLGLLGRAVVVVELDGLFADLPAHLGLEPTRPDLLDLVESPTAPLSRFVVRHHSGVRVLTPPWTRPLPPALDPAAVMPALDRLRRRVDHVLVCLPGGDPRGFGEVLQASHEVFCFDQAAGHSWTNLGRLTRVLEHMGLGPERRVAVRAGHPALSVPEELARQGRFLLLPEDPEEIARARAAGLPVSALAPRGKYARAVAQLAQNLTQGTSGGAALRSCQVAV